RVQSDVPSALQSPGNPGKTFRQAGWRKCAEWGWDDPDAWQRIRKKPAVDVFCCRESSGGLPAGSGIKREWYSAGVLSATQLQQRTIKMQQKSAKKTAPLKPFLSPAFRVQFWRSRLACVQ